MPSLIQLGELEIAVHAERLTAIDQGYLLQGQSVALFHPFGNGYFYRHGWHSWSLTTWVSLSSTLAQPQPPLRWPMIDHPVLLEKYPFAGSAVGAVRGTRGTDEKILSLGALALDGHVSADNLLLRGDYPYAMPGVPSEWYVAYGPEQKVFAAYAHLLGQRFGIRARHPSPRVWCSWYSVYTDISQDLLLNVLQELTDFPFDVFQIDDGWQQNLGDWQSNAKFPQGMTWLAEQIQKAGFTPGLWLAPLAVAPSSKLFQEHPEWLLRDSQGQPVLAGHNWGDRFYGLDTTLPAVHDWLYELIETVRSWGYSYLKLDFLYAGALPAQRHENVSPEAALRQGLEVIRQAAGNAYMLACGAPILPALGLADGLRIGPDVAPYWDNPERSETLHDLSGPGTRNALRTSLHRLWLRPLVDTDPDVAFFRTRFNLMNPLQSTLTQDMAYIAGFRATSDLPAWLDPHERQALLAFLQSQPAVQPLDRYRFQVDQRLVDFTFLANEW